jgi:hypothetical protein
VGKACGGGLGRGGRGGRGTTAPSRKLTEGEHDEDNVGIVRVDVACNGEVGRKRLVVRGEGKAAGGDKRQRGDMTTMITVSSIKKITINQRWCAIAHAVWLSV